MSAGLIAECSVPATARTRLGRAGFSFVEVMIVVLIFSLILLVGLPRLFPQGAQVRSAATEVQAALQKAQRAAVLNGHDVRVVFDDILMRVIVHFDQNNDGEIDAGEPIETVVLPEGTAFGYNEMPALPWGSDAISFPDNEVTFHRDGSASSEGGVYIATIPEIRDGGRRAETRAIEVVRATGTVRCRMPAATGWRDGCQ